jgi:hypothetical protein
MNTTDLNIIRAALDCRIRLPSMNVAHVLPPQPLASRSIVFVSIHGGHRKNKGKVALGRSQFIPPKHLPRVGPAPSHRPILRGSVTEGPIAETRAHKGPMNFRTITTYKNTCVYINDYTTYSTCAQPKQNDSVSSSCSIHGGNTFPPSQ